LAEIKHLASDSYCYLCSFVEVRRWMALLKTHSNCYTTVAVQLFNYLSRKYFPVLFNNNQVDNIFDKANQETL
jgi:hypothetical protein